MISQNKSDKKKSASANNFISNARTPQFFLNSSLFSGKPNIGSRLTVSNYVNTKK